MGVTCSCCRKTELTNADIVFLKKHTRYEEATIRETNDFMFVNYPNIMIIFLIKIYTMVYLTI